MDDLYAPIVSYMAKLGWTVEEFREGPAVRMVAVSQTGEIRTAEASEGTEEQNAYIAVCELAQLCDVDLE